MLERWRLRAMRKEQNPSKACIVHVSACAWASGLLSTQGGWIGQAHLAFLFRNVTDKDLSDKAVAALLSAQIFLNANYRFTLDVVSGSSRFVVPMNGREPV